MPDTDTLQLTDFDQIATGLRWQSARLADLAHYEALWGNVARAAPAEFSEAIAAGAQWLQLAIYPRVSRFWVDALWGRPPAGVDDDLVDVLARASRYRSTGGHGIVAVEADGRRRVIPPANYHPVLDPRDSEDKIGDVISWFWSSTATPNTTPPMPDRVDLVLFGEGVNTRQTWTLDSYALGELIAEEPAGVEAIVVWGDGVSDYRDLEPIVTEMEYRANRLKRTLDWHSDPALTGPELAGKIGKDRPPNLGPALGDGRSSLTERDAVQAATEREYQRQGGAPYLARERDDPPYEYLAFDAQLQHVEWALNWLGDQFNLTTGIPLGALGLADNDDQSGVSRERQLFSAIARLRNLRREVEPALDALGAAAVDWPDAPFSTWPELARVVIELVEAGVQNAVQAANLLGLDALTPEAIRAEVEALGDLAPAPAGE